MGKATEILKQYHLAEGKVGLGRWFGIGGNSAIRVCHRISDPGWERRVGILS